MLFFLRAEAVGEVIVTAAVFVLGNRSGGVLHFRLPYHFGQEIHLPFRVGNVLVDEIGVRQRFLHVPKCVEDCLAVGKVDGEHFKELLFNLRFGEVGGSAFNLVMELVDALPHQTAVLVGGVPGDRRIPRTAIPAEDLCGERRVAEGSLAAGFAPISTIFSEGPFKSHPCNQKKALAKASAFFNEICHAGK